MCASRGSGALLGCCEAARRGREAALLAPPPRVGPRAERTRRATSRRRDAAHRPHHLRWHADCARARV